MYLRGISLRALVFAVLLVALTATSAAGQDDGELIPFDSDEWLNEDEIGPGTCDPESLPISSLTTCTFPLSGEGWDLFDPAGVVATVPDNERSTSAPCYVETTTLVCRDLLTPSWDATFDVQLTGYFSESSLATFTVDRLYDRVIGIIQNVDRIKPAFVGGSLELDVFRAGSLPTEAPVDVLLRRPGSDVEVARARALEPGEFDGSFELTFPDAGRWEFVSCALDDAGDCFRQGIPTPVIALDPAVEPLLADHNNPDDTRINIVFAGTGFDSPAELQRVALQLLQVDGEPIPIDYGGQPTTTDDPEYLQLSWGPFAIDPLRGQAERFNFWYLPDPNTGSPIRLNNFDEPEVDVAPLGLGTP